MSTWTTLVGVIVVLPVIVQSDVTYVDIYSQEVNFYELTWCLDKFYMEMF